MNLFEGHNDYCLPIVAFFNMTLKRIKLEINRTIFCAVKRYSTKRMWATLPSPFLFLDYYKAWSAVQMPERSGIIH